MVDRKIIISDIISQFHLYHSVITCRCVTSNNVKMSSEKGKTLCLYYNPISPPCRHVMLTAKLLKLDLNLICLNLLKGDHLKRSFLRLNPEHKIPTLTDNDFVVTESRVIMAYLVDKYARNDNLYPRDDKIRAKIQQYLYFDSNLMLTPIINYYVPVIFGSKQFDESKMADIENAMKFLNIFLEGKEYLADGQLTIADIALVSSVATAVAAFDFKLTPYPNVEHWFKLLQSTVPHYKEIIDENCQQMRAVLDQMKKQ